MHDLMASKLTYLDFRNVFTGASNSVLKKKLIENGQNWMNKITRYAWFNGI